MVDLSDEDRWLLRRTLQKLRTVRAAWPDDKETAHSLIPGLVKLIGDPVYRTVPDECGHCAADGCPCDKGEKRPRWYVSPDVRRMVDLALDDVKVELLDALQNNGPMHSPHEGYAVILEEVEELWDEIKPNRGWGPEAKAEATQVAAMAIRYLVDISSGRRHV